MGRMILGDKLGERIKVGLAWFFTAVLLACCAPAQGKVFPPAPPRACGVEVESFRVTGGGGFLDLRFKVLEPEAASSLLDPSVPVSLVHEPSGRELTVASSKIGKLRQRTARPETGKEYFILFRNSGGLVNPGERVTLRVGNCKVEGLEVE